MNVSELMTKDVIYIQQDAYPKEALATFQKHHVHHLIVTDARERIVGMLSQGDLRPVVNYLASAEKLKDPNWDSVQLYNVGSVKDLMTPDPLFVSPHDDVSQVAQLMIERQFHSLLVEDHEVLVGIVTSTDLLKAVAKKQLS